MASKKTRRLGQNTESKRGKNPKSLENLAPPFPKGVSGNPGGRPKLLGESYRDWLAKINSEGMTNAEAVALAMGVQAIKGDVSAAREIRAATEGDKITLATWQTEIIEALKVGKLTAQQVLDELGMDDARAILVAAGQTVPQSAQGS